MREYYVYSVSSKGDFMSAKYGIKAKSRLDAIKQMDIEKVYWEGNRPYGVPFIGSKVKVYAVLTRLTDDF